MTVPDEDVSREGAPGVDPTVGPAAGGPGAEAPPATGTCTGGEFGGGVCDGNDEAFDHSADRIATSSFFEFSRRSAVPSCTVVGE